MKRKSKSGKRIIIVGGGPSGVAAAYAAAREGAQVLLVERYGFLGGMGTAGLVHPWMSFYAGKRQIVKGVLDVIIKKLKRRKAYKDSRHFGIKHHCFDHEALKQILLELLVINKVDILFHTYFCDVLIEKNKIKSIIIESKSGMEEIKGDIFIDASGDADVAAIAGAPYTIGRSSDGYMQPMSLHFRMGGVEVDRMPSREIMNKMYIEAKKRGLINCPRENLLWFDTVHNDQIHFNTTRVVKVDGTRKEDLTYAEIESRLQMEEIVNFLKKKVPGFKKSYLLISAPQVGVRETRRIIGKFVLTEEDVLTPHHFEDCIAHNAYPIDIHNPLGEGTVIKTLPWGKFYDIPWRTLLPQRVDNLIVCGRPISSTHEAHSSVRIQAACYATGQAAGVGASLCIKENKNPCDINVKKVQQKLIKQGAYLKLKWN